ncbi:MAG: hypothetical protein R2787_17070 [Saprospiraceae bacterium]
MQALASHHPPVVMEYLDAATSGGGHQEADRLLRSLGYQPYRIDAGGQLHACPDIEGHLQKAGLSSDNLVYQYQAG